ncbi:MAG: RDD family protein [Halobaculum sp.]
MTSPTPKMDTASETVRSRIDAYFFDRLLLLAGSVLILTLFFYLSIDASLVASALGPDADLSPLMVSLLTGATLSSLLTPFVQLTYTLVMETRNGQTYGKRRYDIVVVTTDGDEIGAKATIRMISWFFEGFFFGIPALVAILATDDSQRIGDILAGTVVVEVAE